MYVENQVFRGAQLTVDGGSFHACRFESCKLLYCGTLPVVLTGCALVNCEWVFHGPAAATIDFLKTLYSSDRSGAALVEKIIAQITGAPPKGQPIRLPRGTGRA